MITHQHKSNTISFQAIKFVLMNLRSCREGKQSGMFTKQDPCSMAKCDTFVQFCKLLMYKNSAAVWKHLSIRYVQKVISEHGDDATLMLFKE